jgi:hypothetical protein
MYRTKMLDGKGPVSGRWRLDFFSSQHDASQPLVVPKCGGDVGVFVEQQHRLRSTMSSVDPLVVSCAAAVPAAVAELRAALRRQPAAVVGVDMEWVALKRTGAAKAVPLGLDAATDFTTDKVALVQISTAGRCYLFRTCCFTRPRVAGAGASSAGDEAAEGETVVPGAAGERDVFCPPALAELLADVAVVKFGAGINGDRSRFAKDFGVEAATCVDLAQGFADAAVGKSLADMAQAVLGRQLPKDIAVTCSNWFRAALTAAQLHYAVTDATASLHLGLECLRRAGVMVFADGGASGDDDDGDKADLSTRLLALTVSPAEAPPGDDGGAPADAVREWAARHCLPPLAVKAPKTKRVPGSSKQGKPSSSTAGYAGRLKTYYDNIRALSPSGALLFTISQTKADWYVKQGLCAVTERAAPAAEGGAALGRIVEVQLTFEPGLDRHDSVLRPNKEFFCLPKANCCVVCGADDAASLIRFFIVPAAYRKTFPRELTTHNSFDITLVCVGCMPRARAAYEDERRRIGEEFGFSALGNGHTAATSGGEDNTADAASAVAHNKHIHLIIKTATALVAQETGRIMMVAAAAAAATTGDGDDDAPSSEHDAPAEEDTLADDANDADDGGAAQPGRGKKNKRRPHGGRAAKWSQKQQQCAGMPAARRDELLAALADLCVNYRFPPVDPTRHATLAAATLAALPALDAPVCLSTGEPTHVTWRELHAMSVVDRWKVTLADTEQAATSHFDFVVKKLGDDARKAASPEELLENADALATPMPVLRALCGFVRRWRLVFMEKVAPRFMPEAWDVNQGLVL